MGTPTGTRTSVAPMLSVRGGARAVEFYKSAFGALEVYRVEDPSGAVVSRLSVDGAEFWLSDESPEHGNFSPESLGGGSVRMILTVPDPDAMFAKALAAGAREVVAVEEAYGWRLGRVVDPFGHHWEIGRAVAGRQRPTLHLRVHLQRCPRQAKAAAGGEFRGSTGRRVPGVPPAGRALPGIGWRPSGPRAVPWRPRR